MNARQLTFRLDYLIGKESLYKIVYKTYGFKETYRELSNTLNEIRKRDITNFEKHFLTQMSIYSFNNVICGRI